MSVSQVYNPLIGRHVTSFVLTPLTIAANGAVTNGTPVALTGSLDGLSHSIRPTHEEISPVNSVIQNNVLIDEGSNVSLSIIKVNDGTSPDKLRDAVLAASHFRLVWIEGTGASARTQTMRGIRGNYESGVQGKGKIIASLELLSVDFGADSFTSAA